MTRSEHGNHDEPERRSCPACGWWAALPAEWRPHGYSIRDGRWRCLRCRHVFEDEP